MSRTGPCKEETRERILVKADALFRQFGFGKTTVADIAGELGMSPANIYKFFPTKNAIVQACAERNFKVLQTIVLGIVGSRGGAFKRMERVVLAVFRHHRDLLRNERQIFKIVLAAREENWACIRNYDTFMAETFRQLVTEGVRKGEFHSGNPAKTAATLDDCLALALRPHLRHDYRPDENEARVLAQIRFLGRALR